MKLKNLKVGDVLIDKESHGYETCTVTRVGVDGDGDLMFDVRYGDDDTTCCLGCEDMFVPATKANIKRYDKRVPIGKKLSDDLYSLIGTTRNQMGAIKKLAAKQLNPKKRDALENALDQIDDELNTIECMYKVD